jgi:hypothetical protein
MAIRYESRRFKRRDLGEFGQKREISKASFSWRSGTLLELGACLDVIQIASFFILSITSIFNRLHRVLNIGKKIINYIV